MKRTQVRIKVGRGHLLVVNNVLEGNAEHRVMIIL